MEITAYGLAQRFVGLKELPGPKANPFVLGMLQLDGNSWVKDDETPWCSAFVNFIAWLLRLPRSKSLAARSWLQVGTPVDHLENASVGFDVVVLNRNGGPGADVLDAPGHVGFFGGMQGNSMQGNSRVWVMGGNQRDAVGLAAYDTERVLGVRRLEV